MICILSTITITNNLSEVTGQSLTKCNESDMPSKEVESPHKEEPISKMHVTSNRENNFFSLNNGETNSGAETKTAFTNPEILEDPAEGNKNSGMRRYITSTETEEYNINLHKESNRVNKFHNNEEGSNSCTESKMPFTNSRILEEPVKRNIKCKYA